jgi:rRNA pseudouridine-1189 N-methylase Emg1 (Nep1/Mra1 family)
MSELNLPKEVRDPQKYQRMIELAENGLKKLDKNLENLENSLIPESLTSDNLKSFVDDLQKRRVALTRRLETDKSQVLSTASLKNILNALKGHLIDPSTVRILTETQAMSIYQQALKELDHLHVVLKQLDDERGKKVAKVRNDPT